MKTILGLAPKTFRSEIAKLSLPTLKQLVAALAKDFDDKPPRIANVKQALDYIMDTDTSDLHQFMSNARRKFPALEAMAYPNKKDSKPSKNEKTETKATVNRNTIHEFDRPQVRQFMGEVNLALTEIAAKYGLSFAPSGASFDANSVRIRGEFGTKTEGGDNAAAKATWERNAPFYGMQPSWFGKTFKHGGKVFTIAGINTRARKTPMIIVDGNGKRYRGTAQMVSYGMRGA